MDAQKQVNTAVRVLGAGLRRRGMQGIVVALSPDGVAEGIHIELEDWGCGAAAMERMALRVALELQWVEKLEREAQAPYDRMVIAAEGTP